MKYKIVKKIIDGRRVVGYQLIYKDGSIINASKLRTLEAAKHNLIINATYNKKTNLLQGVNSTDLRKLPTLTINTKQDIDGFIASRIQIDIIMSLLNNTFKNLRCLKCKWSLNYLVTIELSLLE